MFWITASDLQGIPVIELHGDLDFCSAKQARLEMALFGSRMIIDLAKCEFMDCAGLRVLIALRNLAEAAGGWLVLASPGRMPARLLSVLGMDREFLIWGA